MKPYWVKFEWDEDYPCCARCGDDLFKETHEDWHDNPKLRLCYDCAIQTLDELIDK